MKKVKKIQNTEAYSSPEIDAFLALEETINTDYIRTSMLLAAQIEDAMRFNLKPKKPLPNQEAAFLIQNTEGVTPQRHPLIFSPKKHHPFQTPSRFLSISPPS